MRQLFLPVVALALTLSACGIDEANVDDVNAVIEQDTANKEQAVTFAPEYTRNKKGDGSKVENPAGSVPAK